MCVCVQRTGGPRICVLAALLYTHVEEDALLLIVFTNFKALTKLRITLQGRIKKIMQTDEEVGKVASAVPIIIYILFKYRIYAEFFRQYRNRRIFFRLCLHLFDMVNNDFFLN